MTPKNVAAAGQPGDSTLRAGDPRSTTPAGSLLTAAERAALSHVTEPDHIELVVAHIVALRLAEAWQKGYTAGHSIAMRRMSDEPNAPTSANPYAT